MSTILLIDFFVSAFFVLWYGETMFLYVRDAVARGLLTDLDSINLAAQVARKPLRKLSIALASTVIFFTLYLLSI